MSTPTGVLTASYRITTPMFLSGADQTRAELRLPSFKGALRFWWRMLNWSRHGNRTADLKAEEARLFGGTGQGEGQALFLLSLVGQPTTIVSDQAHFSPNTWQGYAGYGLTDARDRPKRSYFAAGGTFQVHCRATHATEEDWQQLRQAMQALGLVGGLGGRSRKGWGSLTLTRLSGVGGDWSAPADAGALRDATDSLRASSTIATGSPLCSALSRSSRIVVGTHVPNSEAAHRTLVELYRAEVRASLPKSSREAFGLPRNGAGKNASCRRASPVFLHVHQSDAQCPAFPIVTFLPAQFLETQDQPAGGWQPVQVLLDKVQS